MEHLRHIAVWWPARRVRVAGVRVRRMTLGHLRVLEAMGSPFIHGGPASPFDAAAALLVLSRPWRAASRLAARGPVFRFAAAGFASRLARGRSASACVAAVDAHVAACLWVPEPYIRDGEAPPAFRPAFGCACRIALRASRLPLAVLCLRPLRRIWDLPADEALLWLACDDELAGREFQTAEEEAAHG